MSKLDNFVFKSIEYSMRKCPYCSKEIHLVDFFEVSTKETKKGKIRIKFEALIYILI